MRRIDSHTRLRALLIALLLGLAVPSWLLFRQASGQLDLEAFRRQQLLAEETAGRIDAALAMAIATESTRPFDDYRFATVAANARSNVVQRSPLSSWPISLALPGVIGHFQVDADGRLATPLLPTDDVDTSDFGLTAEEVSQRNQLEAEIVAVLAENRLVRTMPEARLSQPLRERQTEAPQIQASEAVSAALESELGGQAAFDELAARNLRVTPAATEAATTGPNEISDTLSAARRRLQATFEPTASNAAAGDAAKATDRIDADDAIFADTDRAGAAASEASAVPSAPRVATFESELEPLQFSRLDTGHFVLFRNAWRNNMRFIQGVLLDADRFLRGATQSAFRAGGHAAGTRVFATVENDMVVELTTPAARGMNGRQTDEPLYSTRLSPPLAQVELSFTAGELPHGPASRVLFWTGVVLASVLIGGLYAIYRFGTRQIALTRQQEDFVSAVSHELKTPLTSIRMYGEMLKSGWASEAKKQAYYDYIYAEGERLSRLIDNVLQIARFNRGSVPVTPETISVGALIDVIRSKISTSIERAGFTLHIECDAAASAAKVLVDQDAVVQIFINLIDNAIKFTRDDDKHEIVLSATRPGPDSVLFCVRDFGPGVSPQHLKRLFELFYRPDNEKTRSTAGTGIGLALVRQLAAALGGTIDVRNCEPGAEFRLTLPQKS